MSSRGASVLSVLCLSVSLCVMICVWVDAGLRRLKLLCAYLVSGPREKKPCSTLYLGAACANMDLYVRRTMQNRCISFRRFKGLLIETLQRDSLVLVGTRNHGCKRGGAKALAARTQSE